MLHIWSDIDIVSDIRVQSVIGMQNDAVILNEIGVVKDIIVKSDHHEVQWSVCLPSTLMIKVLIQLKAAIYTLV